MGFGVGLRVVSLGRPSTIMARIEYRGVWEGFREVSLGKPSTIMANIEYCGVWGGV